MSRNFVLVAVLLPLLAIGLGIVRAELRLSSAQTFMFDIEGFDPRDLLHGRYLQFRLRVDEGAAREDCNAEQGQSCCLCLTRRAAEEPPLAERATCETARQQCDGALELHYMTEAQRFYVPEAQASSLEKRLFEAMAAKKARVRLAIEPSGKALVRELLLDGKAVSSGVAR